MPQKGAKRPILASRVLGGLPLMTQCVNPAPAPMRFWP